MFFGMFRKKDQKEKEHAINKVPLSVPNHVVRVEPLSEIKYLYWKEYNHILHTGGVTRGGYASYTHKMCQYYRLNDYINPGLKSILQLGVSAAKFIREKPKHWNRIGYDYIEPNKNDFLFRLLDLNSIDESGAESALAYAAQLQKDLRQPTNIFVIRILEYLTPEASKLLVFALMDYAQPGTRFILVGRALKEQPDNEATHQEAGKPDQRAAKHYTATFFATRTDMKLLLHLQAKADEDEVLIVEKIDRQARPPRSQCKL